MYISEVGGSEFGQNASNREIVVSWFVVTAVVPCVLACVRRRRARLDSVALAGRPAQNPAVSPFFPFPFRHSPFSLFSRGLFPLPLVISLAIPLASSLVVYLVSSFAS